MVPKHHIDPKSLKFGKTPARMGAIKFGLLDYFDIKKMPKVPLEYGHENLVKQDWGMLGNDRYGCCVWAGADHETMLYNAEQGKVVEFNQIVTLGDYSACTGFDTRDPNTDQGTDMVKAAEYRRTTGILDLTGTRHKISAYFGFNAHDPEQLDAAAYLCSAIGLGLEVPETMTPQFAAGQELVFVSGAQIEGGHYVPYVAKRKGLRKIITWGGPALCSDKFIQRYCDEAIAYLTPERLSQAGKTIDGFAMNELMQDLAKLTPVMQ